jgi:hypothetical protein
MKDMAIRTLNILLGAAFLLLLYSFSNNSEASEIHTDGREIYCEDHIASMSFILSVPDYLKSITPNIAKNNGIWQFNYHASGKPAEATSWHNLETNPGIYNLINLITNDALVVFDSLVSTRAVSQIRIILGNINTVLVDGVAYSLLSPTAPSPGLQLPKHTLMALDSANVIVLDLDIEQSVNHLGNGEFRPVPVVRAFINP